jgi:hypothetical protein
MKNKNLAHWVRNIFAVVITVCINILSLALFMHLQFSTTTLLIILLPVIGLSTWINYAISTNGHFWHMAIACIVFIIFIIIKGWHFLILPIQFYQSLAALAILYHHKKKNQ